MADKEYIERGALLITPPFTKYGGDLSKYTEGYLDCAEEARNAVNDAPAAEVVSYELFKLILTERDIAITRLEQIVRCENCRRSRPMIFDGYYYCKRHLVVRKADDYCSRGERKEQT